ncbi:hypothetical protein ElyMa_006809600 [Elysia marginata]|uniref:Uncharacterized protein n=1 Tax=Elysia marginata TaxID=1093978 RepID=A0AAV4J8K9_9GAST|nr:hypothetical protein ElyMa_006809600 [Elysia marginata]
MCRPSDIAPRSGFLRKQIKFNSATITFSAIKNDTNRKGFEIKLTQRTSSDLECGDTPVFMSLTSPSLGVGAATVSQILRKTLHAAGLAEEYTARGFRAAGATAAIRSSCELPASNCNDNDNNVLITPKRFLRSGKQGTPSSYNTGKCKHVLPEESLIFKKDKYVVERPSR